MFAVDGSLILVLLGAVIGAAGRSSLRRIRREARPGRSRRAPRLQRRGTLLGGNALHRHPDHPEGSWPGFAIAIGFVLLIVPGLILLTIWSVAPPSVVVEDKGPFESLGRSRELVRGNGWNVFLSILLAYVIVIVISVVAALDRLRDWAMRDG